METRTLQDLMKDLSDRVRLGEPPPVVLLGAGASAEAGLATMKSLYAFLHLTSFDEFVAYIESRTDNERYRLLAEYLQAPQPLEVTPGYRALAILCEKTYFDVVLTTNFDPLLDDDSGDFAVLAAAISGFVALILVMNGPLSFGAPCQLVTSEKFLRSKPEPVLVSMRELTIPPRTANPDAVVRSRR